jgi:exodeoxyribonuclease VII small subunit
MAKKSTSKSVAELDYEAALRELQKVVATLEGEPESLEEAMALFERGQSLVQRCAQLLEQAELKVKQLSTAREAPPAEE